MLAPATVGSNSILPTSPSQNQTESPSVAKGNDSESDEFSEFDATMAEVVADTPEPVKNLEDAEQVVLIAAQTTDAEQAVAIEGGELDADAQEPAVSVFDIGVADTATRETGSEPVSATTVELPQTVSIAANSGLASTAATSQNIQKTGLVDPAPNPNQPQVNNAIVDGDEYDNALPSAITQESQLSANSSLTMNSSTRASEQGQVGTSDSSPNSKINPENIGDVGTEELAPSDQRMRIGHPQTGEQSYGAETSTLPQQELQAIDIASGTDTIASTANIELTAADANVTETTNVAISHSASASNNQWGIATAKQSELQTSITNQVTDHIVSAKQSSQDGQSQIEIVLDPPELGRVKIELTSRNDQLDARLIVSDAATLDAIKDNLPRLMDSLGDAGLSLDGFQLEGSSPDEAEDQRDTNGSDFIKTQEEAELNSAPGSHTMSKNHIDILI